MYLLSLLALTTLLGSSIADEAPFYANSQYNNGKYGKYVTQTFKSNPAVTAVPVVNFMKPFTNCDDGSYLFIAPRGNIAQSTPMILDITGSPVWASTKRSGQVYNLQVQSYKGSPYLTFWGGNDAVGGHGIGEYFMLDQRYNQRYRIKAANGLGADLHAFTITEDDTALISIYAKKIADIDSVVGHHRKGWIWDSIFQELDIETGEAIFEWRASDHIDVSKSYTDINAATEGDPWDVYHINSVEKDAEGNYLISIRFLRAILYISGKTGEVLWQLGGKDNSFTDLSDGEATTSLGQHDAHWHYKNNEKFITFFDNRADWYHSISKESAGKRILIDTSSMTAQLSQTFTDPLTKILSTSQGSYQTLPNNHVLLGYGFNGAMAEFSENGELLCDAYFQPSSTFGSGDVQSYRNLKFNWTAYPEDSPALTLERKVLYFSWNGATEIVTWILLGSNTDERDWDEELLQNKRAVEDAIVVPKTGFETTYEVLAGDGLKRFVRVVALDKEGRLLGTSNMIDLGDLSGDWQAEEEGDGIRYTGDIVEDHSHDEPVDGDHSNLEKDVGDEQILIGFGVLTVLSVLLVVSLTVGKKQLMRLWRRDSFGEDTEKMAVHEGNEGGRLAQLWQRVVAIVPRWRRKDHFTETSAKEGLLAQDDRPQDFGEVGTCRSER
ncbi:hypothetical protein HII31_11000 [Pseudocercospora fuligena]|uniref:ASST-domain-containing protein n=1 Tax=Pseudocercospora fuligena TaxID=685502 RepID=A0A8H6RAQ7_9PEZI|nr:hypothetical protein HII31_11000 [Pseudocercospora fuligena]